MLASAPTDPAAATAAYAAAEYMEGDSTSLPLPPESVEKRVDGLFHLTKIKGREEVKKVFTELPLGAVVFTKVPKIEEL